MKLDERIEGFKRTPAPDLWPEIEHREPITELTSAATGWRRLAIVAAALAIGAAAVILVARTYPRHEAVVQPSNPTAANGVIAYAPIGEQQVFWTISPDGSEKTKVPVDVPGFIGVPSWSPDGSEIAFAVNSYDDPHPEGGNWDIYVAGADGSDPQRLTTDHVDHSPAWSPDGTQQIAYVYGYGDDQQIRVMNADGSDVRELTSSHGFHSFPTWSPDGSQIAYVAFDGTNANIYVMNADGSGSHRVTDDPAHEDAPAWSPGGRLIAFTSEGGARAPGVYAMSPDGTGVTQLTHDPDPANLSIAWSPDGTKMALVSIRGTDYDRNIYLLDLASRAVMTVGQPGAYTGVSWQPVSNEVSDVPSASPPVTISSVGGIQVGVPPGWAVARENLTPWLSHPTEVLSVGTFRMPVSHDPDDEPRVFDAPVAPAALAAMTATDAFVSLQESGPTNAPDDRPPSFRTAEDRACCSAQTGDYPFTWWWIPFIDQGRAFYLFVAIGNRADTTTSDQAWAIADSLVVANESETPTAPSAP